MGCGARREICSSQNRLRFSLHVCWVHVVHIQTDGGKRKEPKEKALEAGRKAVAEHLWGSKTSPASSDFVPSRCPVKAILQEKVA